MGKSRRRLKEAQRSAAAAKPKISKYAAKQNKPVPPPVEQKEKNSVGIEGLGSNFNHKAPKANLPAYQRICKIGNRDVLNPYEKDNEGFKKFVTFAYPRAAKFYELHKINDKEKIALPKVDSTKEKFAIFLSAQEVESGWEIKRHIGRGINGLEFPGETDTVYEGDDFNTSEIALILKMWSFGAYKYNNDWDSVLGVDLDYEPEALLVVCEAEWSRLTHHQIQLVEPWPDQNVEHGVDISEEENTFDAS